MAINSQGDVRVMRFMLESLSDAVFRSRLYVVRDIEPKFPKYAKELHAVAADLAVVADKIYEIMMRSMDEEGEEENDRK